jgi:hypothetical protein
MSSLAPTGKKDGTTVYVDVIYSLLDLLKYATNTIVKTMRPKDRLAIIQFDYRQDLILPFTPMTSKNQDAECFKIDLLSIRGGTKIYEAIDSAM